MREKTCCFTGHRPQKLSYGYDEAHGDCVKLKKFLALEIKGMLEKGITTFYSGMALGTDIWCAELVLAYQEKYPMLGIRLIPAIPFAGQADRWSESYRKRYYSIIERAGNRKVLREHYTKDCMMERNRYMVDRSSHIIGVFNGEAGGTKNTLSYAKGQGLSIVCINPNTFEVLRRTIPQHL